MKKKKRKSGFTIVELLITVGIIVILAAIILFVINRSRAKAADARTQETLSNIRTIATEEKIAGASFTTAFSLGPVHDAVITLAAQQGVAEADYHVQASDEEFVVAFPLVAEDGYWCVDAQGSSKRVPGKPTGTAPYTCDNVEAGGDEEEGDSVPSITLLGNNPMWFTDPGHIIGYNPFYYYADPGATASDEEDGNLTPTIKVTGPTPAGGHEEDSNCWYESYIVTYRVTDADGHQTQKNRTANRIYQGTCPGKPITNGPGGGGGGGGLGGGELLIVE